MVSDLRHGFRVGAWDIEPLRGAITGPNGEAHHLEPKVMDVFVFLAEHPNELVTRNQLLDVVWTGQVAADELLTRAISELRRALQEDPGDPTYIETVPKRGYRLIGEVLPLADIKPEKKGARFKSFANFTGRRLDFIVILLLCVGLLLFAYEKWWTDTPPELSIAVLPFENLSADPEQEYFSDGISEEILNLLAQVESLKVIARHSSFSFKGQAVDIATMAEQLNVRHLLEGSVRRSGDRVRITAQLIDARDSSHLWSEAYERDYSAENLFEIQSDGEYRSVCCLSSWPRAAQESQGRRAGRCRRAIFAGDRARPAIRRRLRGPCRRVWPLRFVLGRAEQ
jgi:TolB-like protein/DNA-binding winged helix-turn-helix (wHTH) protein